MKIFAAEIRENEDVEAQFLVKEKTLALTKSGNPYLRLKLCDRSGEIEGRIWNSVETIASSFQKNDFVALRGKAVLFQDRLQLNITHIEKVDEGKITLSDFFPMTEKDVSVMFQSLTDISRKVKNPFLSNLLNLFWEDSAFVEAFKNVPASKKLHHAYLGGLLEHTLSTAELVLKNSSHYPEIDVDLLLTGAILHDIGKVYELSYDRTFDYTDEGRLLGHITIGIQKLEEKIQRLPGFPKELAIRLKHLLLSHHGQYVFGSPKRPMTLEAIMLHYLDDMDAKINGVKEFLRSNVAEGSRWSAYHPSFEQSFYLPPVDQFGTGDLPDEGIET